MKYKFLKFLPIVALSSAVLVGCADDDFSAPDLTCVDPGLTANKTVQDLYNTASSTITQYTEDDIIEAYVVSSDRGGNFFKSVSLQTLDGSRAFSVTLDVSNTFSKGFNVGRKVYVKLKDLHYNITHSSLIIGELYTNPNSGAVSVGRINPITYKNHIVLGCDSVEESSLIQRMTIQQAKSNANINKLIELDMVEFEQSAVGGTYYDANNSIGGATNLNLVDANGNSVIFRTSSFAKYAGDIVPNKSGKVIGVMTKFNSDFQFVARDRNDIQLTNPRLNDQTVDPGNPDPEEPVEPEQPEIPGDDAVYAFPGGSFEDWALFTSNMNSFGIQSYATQSVGTGVANTASLHINTTGAGGNDYVFTSYPSENMPATYSKITFWMKGTSAKSLSFNVYKEGTGYYVFNLGNVSGSKEVSVAGNNQYNGVIDTNGEWIKITLDLTGITDLNTSNRTSNFFALKVGSGQPYDLHLDNFVIE